MVRDNVQFVLSGTLAKSKLYIIGVSGGPDSLFLLDNLRRAEYRIIVAHVNYKKRIESDQDENLIKVYCKNHSLLCEIYQAKETKYDSISNFQDKARKIRYRFFQKLADKYQTKYIVVAHQFDDHLETYLLQKKRKSLVSHWGLPIKCKQGKYWILRPLLSLDKQDIYSYLIKNKIVYAEDKSNKLLIYQRNIIRQTLNNLNPEKKRNLAKEIENENQTLEKDKILVNKEIKKNILSSSLLLLSEKKVDQKKYLRLLYFWVNRRTNGILQKRKKKLLLEIFKQLFVSSKADLIISLGKDFQIIKSGRWAKLIKKN